MFRVQTLQTKVKEQDSMYKLKNYPDYSFTVILLTISSKQVRPCHLQMHLNPPPKFWFDYERPMNLFYKSEK